MQQQPIVPLSPINTQETPDPSKPIMESYYGSVTVKVIAIAVLILLLQIPSFKIQNLIRDRETRRDTAVSEASAQWGANQTIVGPVVRIPYKVFTSEEKTVNNQKEVKIKEEKRFAYFLPKELSIEADAKTETRKRGIYTIVLYSAPINLAGSFDFDLSSLKIPAENVLFDEAAIWLSVGDAHGIADTPKGGGGGKPIKLAPQEGGLGAEIHLSYGAKSYPFTLSLTLNGSEKILFAPLGEETKAAMKSNWNSPNFTGAFLPANREIANDGFNASWKFVQFNRNYPQSWVSGNESDFLPDSAEQSYFGVEFFQPVNVYQKSMRSVKYNLMFLGLTFAAFFLVEALTKKLKTVHPVQYLLVGAAMALFYLLLLSLSEHIPFIAAYTIASVATIALIVGYIKAVFGRGTVALLLGSLLAAMHIFLYIALDAEDYALLVGSIGLFVILAIIMRVSRHIRWYELAKQ